MERFRRLWTYLLPLLLLTVLTGQADAALKAVGPVDPVTTIPVYYQDPNNLALMPCLDQNGMCLLPGASLPGVIPATPNFDPALGAFTPITTTGPINNVNFPGEGFYYSAQAIMPIENGELANLAYVLEYAFLAGVTPDAAIVFLRTDLQKMINLAPSSTYRVTHPYGTFDFTTDAQGNARGGGGVVLRLEDPAGGAGVAVNYITPAMKAAVDTNIGPFLKPADGILLTRVVGGQTHTYLSDPAVPVPVTGGTNGNLFIIDRLTGPGGTPVPGAHWQTNLFAVTARVFTGTAASPMTIDRFTYSRDAVSGQVDAFVTAETGATLTINGTGIPTTVMSENVPGSGKFFAHIPFTTTLPTALTITNSLDFPTPVAHPVTLTDEVDITEAQYDPVTKNLTITAVSRDKVNPPVLTAPQLPAPNTLVAGKLVKSLALTIPPAFVTVASSNLGSSAPAPVRVVILPPPPVAVADSAATLKNTAVVINVLANDTPAVNIDPAAVVTANPLNGTAVANAGGSVTFTPTAEFTGTASFTYTVKDAFGQISNTATVTVTVHAPPVAANDTATAAVNTLVSINVIANDTAFSSSVNSTTVNIVSPASCGTTNVLTTGIVEFTAPAVAGTCSFSYVVNDSFVPPAGSNVATVTVTVIAPPVITAGAGPNGIISPAGVTSVPAGANKTYTITPNAGFTVSNLVVDGLLLPGATTYTFSNVVADHYINAYFTGQTFTLTPSAGANGSITPAAPVTALYGAANSFTVNPNPGFQIASLVADGVALPVASAYTFTSITGNHTISATFAALSGNFTINGGAGPNGSISPAGNATVIAGANQSYTITPNPGYIVSALSVDGTVLPGATSYTFTNVAADHYINAYFAPIPVVTFTINGGAGPNGTISPPGNTTVVSGTNQSYTITPNPGFAVTALVVDGTLLPGATTHTFTNVTTDHYINAYFAAATATITAGAAPNGSISPTGTSVVNVGANQTYTITADPGFVVTNLVVDGAILPGAPSHTFTNVTGDHYINAYFGP